MPTVGNYLPQDDKEDHVARSLTPGRVLYLLCDFTKPKKNKYLILAVPGEKSLLLVINSNIPRFVSRNPELLRSQVKISSSDHPFLDHDSYANCAEVKEVSRKDLVEQLLQDTSNIKGEISTEAKAEIVRVVKGARTVPAAYKKLIAEALE